jgi:spore coat polysaccharide biosynthesis protein SpsF
MSAPSQIWAAQFGKDYTERNTTDALLRENVAFYGERFRRMPDRPRTVLELGCNSGMNIAALRMLDEQIEATAVEVNATAAALARQHAKTVHNVPISQFQTDQQFDLVLCRGILIHLPPDELEHAYRVIAQAARRYVLLAEYYNPSPTEIPYRGNAGMMWKRDFAGELMAISPDLRLIDYGFVYKADPFYKNWSDVTWFLFQR